MFLIVGLGNPGSEYEETRHNIGFMFLDHIARSAGVTFPEKLQFQSFLTKCTWQGFQLILLKPQMFMNRSGKSVIEAMHFYKISPDHVIIVFDDLDQEFGAVRLRYGGSHGGHNGMRDILTKMGNDRFHRIKVGIGRPKFKGDAVNWVLGRFSNHEMAHLETVSFLTCEDRLKNVLHHPAPR